MTLEVSGRRAESPRDSAETRPLARRIRHLAEYALLRAVAAVFATLPYRVALAASAALAMVSYPFAVRRRREAVRRIEQVMGERRTRREIRRIARASWRNLFLNAVEIARFHRIDDRWIDRHVDWRAAERVRATLSERGGAILALPHLGPWDLAGVIAARRGLPLFSIARRQRNPWVDRWLNERRSVSGMPVIPNDAHLLRGVLQRLRAGQALAMLPDVRARHGGVPVPFLGHTAWWGAGAARFAREAKVPILPVIMRRRGWARHELRVFDPVEPDPDADRDADTRRMLGELAQMLTRAIEETPEQYFWFNKRWVLDPPEGAEEADRNRERGTLARSRESRARPLVLLDIDGTLLDTRGAGRRAFQRALRAEFGWEDDIAYINFSGATDLDVLHRILQHHGVAADRTRVESFFRHLARELDEALTREPPRVLPGVPELLTRLSADRGVLIGLVTGNTEACAQIKLRHAGLHGHFVLGAFGHEHADRREIARLALRRAREHAGGAELAPVLLIGDTPMDIAAARAIGAVAVAVATGRHSVDHLREAGADIVVETLMNVEAIERLLGC